MEGKDHTGQRRPWRSQHGRGGGGVEGRTQLTHHAPQVQVFGRVQLAVHEQGELLLHDREIVHLGGRRTVSAPAEPPLPSATLAMPPPSLTPSPAVPQALVGRMLLPRTWVYSVRCRRVMLTRWGLPSVTGLVVRAKT